MDKAMILSRATRYVKQIQESLRDREVAGSDLRTMNTVVLIDKPPGATPKLERKPLLDVEAHFFGKRVMVRIHCKDGKCFFQECASHVLHEDGKC
jgi:hypothetical protein